MEISELYQLYLQHPSVSTDSRTVVPGSIFFALKGENFDGNKYASAALNKGAAYAVIDNPEYTSSDKTILVMDTLACLQELARIHIKKLKPGLKVIGLTGSNGKTTTKELMHEVLAKKCNVLSTRGNLNNHIGVPLTCLQINSKTEIAIIEMGANHHGEIALLSSIAQPDYGIIINIGHAHLEGFGSPEGVLRAKSELFDYVNHHKGKIIINANQPLLLKQASKYSCEKIYFGLHEQSKVFAEPVENQTPALIAGIHFRDIRNKVTVKTNLTGSYNIDNLLAAAVVGNEFEIEHQNIFAAFEAYTPENNRSQMVKAGSNQIIMDAYNANPTSMKAAIENLDTIKTKQSKIAILGEMKELGEYQYDAHHEILQLALDSSIAEIITLGEAFKEIRVENKKLIQYLTLEDLNGHLLSKKPDNSIILIKGSRTNKLESVMSYLNPEQ